jgi:hypothetical protein
MSARGIAGYSAESALGTRVSTLVSTSGLSLRAHRGPSTPSVPPSTPQEPREKLRQYGAGAASVPRRHRVGTASVPCWHCVGTASAPRACSAEFPTSAFQFVA